MDRQLEYTIKFGFICLCFVISAVSYRFCFSKRDCGFLISGMALTVVSDFFLVYRDMDYRGLFIFFTVHAAYMLRASRHTKRCAVFIAALTACFAPFYFFFDPVGVAAVLYACFFACDLIINVRMYTIKNNFIPRKNKILILTGLCLFLLCDLSVVVFNLPRYYAVSGGVTQTAYVVMWICYLSSQLLLSVSGLKYKTENA